MMKFNFFSPVKKPSTVDRGKYEHFLTLDIGTEAVKAIIFKRLIGAEKENQKVVVLGKSIEYYNKSNVFDTLEFGENTIKKTIEEVLKGIQQNFLETLKRETKKQNLNIGLKSFPVLIGLPPNILKEKIDIHSYERKEPRSLISKKEESLIYQTISKEIQEKVGDDFQQEFGILPTDVQLLDFKIIEIKIDGYEVFHLEGYKGKKLDFRIFTIFIPKKYLENIGKIAKELKLKIYKILDKNQNLSYLFPDNSLDAIFLDVGGEISQVSLIKKGKLETISEFPNGGIDFSEKLSKVLGLNLEDSRVLKHNYSRAILSEEVRKRVKEILSEELLGWFGKLKRTLKKILVSQRIILPSNIFIFGGGSLLPEIPEILEEGDWTDFPFNYKPKIRSILAKDLRIVEDKTSSLISLQDIPPLLICFPTIKI